MLDQLLRLLAAIGPAAIWIIIFVIIVVGVFLLYLGIALWATLRAKDPDQQKIRYQVFRDLLEAFLRRRRG